MHGVAPNEFPQAPVMVITPLTMSNQLHSLYRKKDNDYAALDAILIFNLEIIVIETITFNYWIQPN